MGSRHGRNKRRADRERIVMLERQVHALQSARFERQNGERLRDRDRGEVADLIRRHEGYMNTMCREAMGKAGAAFGASAVFEVAKAIAGRELVPQMSSRLEISADYRGWQDDYVVHVVIPRIPHAFEVPSRMERGFDEHLDREAQDRRRRQEGYEALQQVMQNPDLLRRIEREARALHGYHYAHVDDDDRPRDELGFRLGPLRRWDVP